MANYIGAVVPPASFLKQWGLLGGEISYCYRKQITLTEEDDDVQREVGNCDEGRAGAGPAA